MDGRLLITHSRRRILVMLPVVVAAMVVTLALLLPALPAWAARLSIPQAGVSFEAPPGFTTLNKDEIAQKYPSDHAPSLVVGDAQRTTTIAYTLKSHGLPSEDLEIAQSHLEAALTREVPGLEWIDRRLERIDGLQWIVLEMRSQAIDADIHNIMLVTSLRGKMLVFNFNSTRQAFPAMSAALRKSIQSITVRAR